MSFAVADQNYKSYGIATAAGVVDLGHHTGHGDIKSIRKFTFLMSFSERRFSRKVVSDNWTQINIVNIKKNWIAIQKKYDVPVNAIGMKINPKDEKTLKIWREEGIDTYMRK